MDWLHTRTFFSFLPSTSVWWFLVFGRTIMNLLPSHKGKGQPITEACSYCGSHAMCGHVTPAVTASCLSKESRCGDLLICTAALLTHWDVFDDIFPSHFSFPLLLTSILWLPHSLSLVFSRSCIFCLYFLSFLSSFFSCLILPLFLIHPPSCLLSLSLHATCHAEKASWYFIKHNMRRRMKFMSLICFNHNLSQDWENFEM